MPHCPTATTSLSVWARAREVTTSGPAATVAATTVRLRNVRRSMDGAMERPPALRVGSLVRCRGMVSPRRPLLGHLRVAVGPGVDAIEDHPGDGRHLVALAGREH